MHVGDGWEATGSELNEYAAQRAVLSWTSEGLYETGTCCDLSPHSGGLTKEGGANKMLIPLLKCNGFIGITHVVSNVNQ